jgi:hypothetical protein
MYVYATYQAEQSSFFISHRRSDIHVAGVGHGVPSRRALATAQHRQVVHVVRPVIHFQQQRAIRLISNASRHSQTLIVAPIVVFRVDSCSPQLQGTVKDS